MTDSVYTFKVIVVGTILGCVIGESYLFQNYRTTPRRNNKFYVRQSPRQPGVIFAENNGFGFRVTQLPRGVFAARPRSSHPAFRPNPLGSLVGASSAGPPAKTGVQRLGTDPALATTQQDPQKLIDFLVNVIIQSQKRKSKGKSTSLSSPVLPVVEGSHLMTYTLPKGPHLLQKHTLSESSNIPTHTLFKSSHVPTHTLSKDSHVPTHSLHKGSQLPTTNTLSESSHVPTHIHPFQNLGSENPVSTVIVHSHGPGQIPHVHVVNLNASNSPLFSWIGYHRPNTIQTSVPNILQISLPNPLMHDLFDKLPHFLTGANKKEVLTKAVNTTLLKPTKIPIVPVRLQILPPSQSTQPTRSLTKSPAETDKEDEDFEGAGDGPINSVTKISEPDRQIRSPRQEPAYLPTTPMTGSPATTPTTPTTTTGVLVTTTFTPTPVTPVTTPPMTTPVVPVTSPSTTIEPRATVSPTTPTTNPATPTTTPVTPTTNPTTPTTTTVTPTTTPGTPTTTPTTPITEPIQPITILSTNIYTNSL